MRVHVAVVLAAVALVAVADDPRQVIRVQDEKEPNEVQKMTSMMKTSLNNDGGGWKKIGDGYCFENAEEEQPHRMGDWRKGRLFDAKVACEKTPGCAGVHVDEDEKPDFVLLSKIGNPGDQEPGVRSCHAYKKPPPKAFSLKCEPAGFFDCQTTTTKGAKLDWFIKLYSPRCDHCHLLKAPWEALAKTQQGKINIARLDCTSKYGEIVCGSVKMNGVPTLLLFRKGHYYRYDGPHKVEAMEEWLEEWYDGEMGDFKGLPIPGKKQKGAKSKSAKTAGGGAGKTKEKAGGKKKKKAAKNNAGKPDGGKAGKANGKDEL